MDRSESAMIKLKVNGRARTAEVAADTPLLWTLRDALDLKGPKFGCGVAQCGACTVHIDGRAVRSCITPVASVGEAEVTTIEGVDATAVGRAVQKAWMKLDVPQCGYCQAGQIMSASALLTRIPAPTDEEIDQAMAGNLCRCCTYLRIRAAIKEAAHALRKGGRS
jgi:isoquinoline 1-oxidoreductase alpha subunit